ncbi:uncharacterized protein LOC119105730 [Pollicipes pollicipes]|uniref:uncharacterized protein LOC119105730 n=1 Tax=Pollicipes pollicipes TaxID=41117 RepID=UPI00188546B3|nr:uncharacterized protein LOC119105730 [Pollicipes pollicipes]
MDSRRVVRTVTSRRYVTSSHGSTEPDQEGNYVTSMVTEGGAEPMSTTSYSYSSGAPDGSETVTREVRTRSYRIEAGGAASALLESAGVTHPETGETLTLGEAAERRLFEPRGGCFLHPSTGARHSVDEAVGMGLLDPALRQLMHQQSGVFDGRSDRPLTLLEAMMDGLMDPQLSAFVGPSGARGERPRQVSDAPRRPTLLEAVIAGQVDTTTGEVTDTESGRRYPLPEAFERGLLSLAHDYTRMCGVSLSDAVQQGLVDYVSGKFEDRNNGERLQLQDAISRGLINPNIHEVLNTETGVKLTVNDAIKEGIIKPEQGRFIDKKTRKRMLLIDAVKQYMLGRPLTLKDIHDGGRMETSGTIYDLVTKERVPLLEAVRRGIVDTQLKCVTNLSTAQLLTLPEAFAESIILPEGKFRDPQTDDVFSLNEAVNRGLITSVATKTIFDIDGIKDPDTGDYVSLNVALTKGIVNRTTGDFRDSSGRAIPLDEAVTQRYIQPQINEMLARPIGIHEGGHELTVFRAVLRTRLDPQTGQVTDPETLEPMPLEEAVHRRHITPEGASLLKSMLNITVTTATVTKTIKRYVTVTSQGQEGRPTPMSFDDAVRRGYIDETLNIFIVPSSGQKVPLDEAVREGLLEEVPTDYEPGRPYAPRSTTSTTTRTYRTYVTRSGEKRPTPERGSSPPKRLRDWSAEKSPSPGQEAPGSPAAPDDGFGRTTRTTRVVRSSYEAEPETTTKIYKRVARRPQGGSGGDADGDGAQVCDEAHGAPTQADGPPGPPDRRGGGGGGDDHCARDARGRLVPRRGHPNEVL